MNKLLNMVVNQGLALNNRAAESTANGLDWLFNRDTLIQSGRTWFELVYDSDLMAVRYYDLPEDDEIELIDGSRKTIERKKHAVPLVLVPPLGTTTETFDLLPNRSLVRYMVASGFKVYLVDWGKPTKRHGNLGLREYSYTMMNVALEKVRQHSGSQDLSLMGWCMGGLLSLLYQGQTLDKHIRNIITVASPIDIESGKGMICALADVATRLKGPAHLVSNSSSLLNSIDPARMLSMTPWMTTMLFKMTDPVGAVTTYWDLVTKLSDRKSLESYSTTYDYANNMLMYPGGVVKDLIVTVVADNQLAKGRVTLGDHVAKLDAIQCDLLSFAGKTDGIVPIKVAEKIVDIVASKDADFRITPGGHMGVMIGSKAQDTMWTQSVEWLSSRSGKASVNASRKKSATNNETGTL